MDVLPKEIDVTYDFKNEMLYCLKNNKISGIDLKMYAFFKFDIPELKQEISIRSAQFLNDMDGQMYLNQYKIFPNFSHLKRYMPVIMTKQM